MILEYEREKVLDAFCKKHLHIQQLMDDEYMEYVNYYRKKRKYIFFGRNFTDEEIDDIMDGQHWFYGQRIHRYSLNSILELRYEIQMNALQKCINALKNCEADTVKLTETEFNLIRKFYGKIT